MFAAHRLSGDQNTRAHAKPALKAHCKCTTFIPVGLSLAAFSSHSSSEWSNRCASLSGALGATMPERARQLQGLCLRNVTPSVVTLQDITTAHA